MPASLTDVAPSVAALLGVPGAPDRLGLAGRSTARRVVLVLVDGLGLHLLPHAAPHAPLLADVLAGRTGRLDELQSTFPSTTPTSLTTLATDASPGRHGVLGFTVRVPGTDRLLTHVRWADEPDPARWQPVPTWFERCAAAGVGVTAVLPEAFLAGGLTRAAYRGARPAGLTSDEDVVDRLVAELTRPGTRLVYGYTSVLDTAMHVHGIASEAWGEAAAQVDTLLARLRERLPDDTALIVTADHGGLDVGPDDRLDLAGEPQLRDGVELVAGEPRVRYLYTRPGAAGDVLAAWQERLGPAAVVQSRDETVAAGRFGAVADAHLARIGDVVVTCRAPIAVLDTVHEPPEIARLVGFHGADTAAETAIPLIEL